MKARLVWVAGPLVGIHVPLDREPIVVGRGRSSDVLVPDASVSRRHCCIEWSPSGYRLTDLGSRHGTRVRGMAVEGRILEDRDRVQIGESVFIFQASAEGEPNSAGAAVTMSASALRSLRTHELRPEDGLFAHPERVLQVSDEVSARSSAGLAALLRVSQAVRADVDPSELGARLVDLIFEFVPADRAGLFLATAPAGQAPGDAFPCLAARTWLGLPEPSAPWSESVLARVVGDGNALLLEGAEPTPSAEGAEADRPRSIVCVPVAHPGRRIGALYLDGERAGSKLDEGHLELASAIASIAALPLEASLAAVRPEAAPAVAPAAESEGGVRGAVVLRPGGPLELGGALSLLEAMSRFVHSPVPRTLVMDYGLALRGPAGLPAEATLERLALLPEAWLARTALASQSPAVARTAALIASGLAPVGPVRHRDGRSWFREVLLTAGLLLSRATHIVLEGEAPTPDEQTGEFTLADALREAGPHPPELAAAAALFARLERVEPRRWPAPVSITPGVGPFLALDGRGLMGMSPRGTLFLSDPADVVARKVRSARTDARPHLDPEQELAPEVCNLVLLLHAVGGEPVQTLLARFAGKGYGALKSELAEAANAFLEPIRARKRQLLEDPDRCRLLLRGGEALEAEAAAVAAAFARPAGKAA